MPSSVSVANRTGHDRRDQVESYSALGFGAFARKPREHPYAGFKTAGSTAYCAIGNARAKSDGQLPDSYWIRSG